MVPEAPLEATDAGLVQAGPGWFVVNAPEHQNGPEWGGYPAEEAALRHGAGADAETTDPFVAYAKVPRREATRYREGWLPDS